MFTKIDRARAEEPPTVPVVPCLGCRKDFVWWVHPVQLCDDCVDLEYVKAMAEMSLRCLGIEE